MFNATARAVLQFRACAFVVVLGVLVFVHEFGHYLAARWRGVHVETFSIGFGRAITSWTDRHGTHWKLAWLPLGGYVKMHGQERPEDVSDEVRASWIAGPHLPREIRVRRARSSSPPGRSPISCWPWCCSPACSRVGQPVTLPVVGEVLPASAAAHAGLQANDRIVAINGAADRRRSRISSASSRPIRPKPVLTMRRGGADQHRHRPVSTHDAGDGRPRSASWASAAARSTISRSVPASAVGRA